MYYLPVGNSNLDPDTLCMDGRYNHHHQLQSRLDFVRYVLVLMFGVLAIHLTCRVYVGSRVLVDS